MPRGLSRRSRCGSAAERTSILYTVQRANARRREVRLLRRSSEYCEFSLTSHDEASSAEVEADDGGADHRDPQQLEARDAFAKEHGSDDDARRRSDAAPRGVRDAQWEAAQRQWENGEAQPIGRVHSPKPHRRPARRELHARRRNDLEQDGDTENDQRR